MSHMPRLRRLASSIPGLAGLSRTVCCEEPSQRRPRPSIFEVSRLDPGVWSDKQKIVAHYLADVDRLRPLNAEVPSHQPFVSQPSGGGRILRVVSWNVNNLCGVGSNSKPSNHTPSEFLEVLRRLQPDVIILQEAVSDGSVYDDASFEEACRRVQHLEDAMSADGLVVCKSSCGNPTLLATALPVINTVSFNLDDDHQWSQTVSTTPGRLKRDANGVKLKVNESRAALYVQLDVAGRQFGIYSTHLHHRNYVDTPDGARAAEMKVLLAHQESRRDRAALVVGDLNQPREKDYSPEEWAIIAAAGKSPRTDGVDDLLQASGFRACWDLAGAPPMTHWTGTTVDYAYLQSRIPGLSVAGAHVFFTPLSDHLPVVVDFAIGDGG